MTLVEAVVVINAVALFILGVRFDAHMRKYHPDPPRRTPLSNMASERGQVRAVRTQPSPKPVSTLPTDPPPRAS